VDAYQKTGFSLRLVEATMALSPRTAKNLLLAARHQCIAPRLEATPLEGADEMSTQRATPCARRHVPRRNREDGPARQARVLLAEDDRELRRLLAAELRKEGYLVKEAATGFELLERLGDVALRNEGFDLIVTDIRMPGLTGLSVAEGLRNGMKPGDHGIPIILITAFGDDDTHAEAKRLGTVIFDKPFDLDEFRVCAMNLVSPVLA
jgi:CheY-like chemotaxis protein